MACHRRGASWSVAALLLVAARWIEPPITAVHIQRRLQAWIHHTPLSERHKFIPLSQISADLQHAVIAAEDAHFYQHHGFDWHEIQIAAKAIWKAIALAELPPLRSTRKKPIFRNGPLYPPQGAEVTLVRWPNSSSANSAFWRYTSTWSNGALVFMVQSRRVVTTTKPQPGISAGNRRHGLLQFCRLPEATTRSHE